MTKETFMLLSLKEEKARKLAQAISSPTCRKILDHLAGREATESELSEALGMPISTIHYNLAQLRGSRLVETEHFHYSKKGKEVLHYKLANKYIIIAPKEESSVAEMFKNLIPISLILAAVVGTWQFLARNTMMAATAVPEAASFAKADQLLAAAPATAPTAALAVQPAVWPWFVYGALAALAVYVVVQLARRYIFKRS